MRKTSLAGLRFFCAGIGSLLAVALAGMAVLAQEPSIGPAVPMPKDPKQLMLLAARTNSLSGKGMQPWHLDASFTLYDANGNASGQGTVEISWISNHRYKVVYSEATFSQTYYETEKGTLASGRENPLPAPLMWVADKFIWPTLPPDALNELKFERHDQDAGGTKLVCLTLKDPKDKSRGKFLIPTYCFDSNLPVLRIGSHQGDFHRFLRNNIFRFQDRYVPRDIAAVVAHKTDLKVHLEDLEVLKTINEADFEPPPDAQPVVPWITISTAEAQALALQQPTPLYPPIARLAHVSGTVELEVYLGTEGHVLSVHAIGGPAMLLQAAEDGVKHWIYRPYLQNGQTVEVKTTVKVVFPPYGQPHAVR